MKKLIPVLVYCLFIFLFASCQTFSTIPMVREFYKNIELNKNSSIYFENLHGDLEIIGWEKDSIEIYAKKTGTDSQLRQTHIDILKKEDNLYIKTLFPRADTQSIFVDFELRVPENILFKKIEIKKGNLNSFQIYGELQVSIKEGNIEIEDFSGTCNVFTDKGYIVARIFENREKDNFTIKTTDGDIRLYLPPQLDAQIEAETRQGEILSDFELEEREKESQKKWTKTLGKGGTKIKIKSGSGEIQIKKISSFPL